MTPTTMTTAAASNSSRVKGSFLESVSPVPLLVDTTTDDDSIVFEDDYDDDNETPTSQFDQSQASFQESPMIDHESVSSDRDVFLKILKKKLKHRKETATPLSSSKKKKSSRETSTKSKLKIGTSSETTVFTPSPTKSSPTALQQSNSPLLHSPKKRHYKSFLLLLQPKKKTFELVEIRYESATATIGDMIGMIPHRATVAEFSNQTYTGFVRPKDGMEFVNFSEVGAERIDHHEVLVAINQGWTGSQALLCSQPILANRRMIKLLGKADKHKKKQRDKHHCQSPSRDGKRSVPPLMPIQEQPAVEEATRLFTTPTSSSHHQQPKTTASTPTSQALVVPVEKCSKAVPLLTRVASPDDSSSVSSGSTLSLASSRTEYHVVTYSKRNKRRKRAKRRAVAIKCGAGGLLCLVATYLMDSSFETTAHDTAMGIVGLGQMVVLLVALITMQKHVQRNNDKRVHAAARRHVGFGSRSTL